MNKLQITKKDFENRLRQINMDIEQIVRKLIDDTKIPTDVRILALKEIRHVLITQFLDLLKD